MPTGSIFDSETDSSSSNTSKIIIGLVALLVLCGTGFGLYWYTKPIPRGSDAILADEIRDTTVLMLAHPTFSGEDFREQVLGKGRVVKFVKSLKDTYFVFPAGDDGEFNNFVAKY